MQSRYNILLTRDYTMSLDEATVPPPACRFCSVVTTVDYSDDVMLLQCAWHSSAHVDKIMYSSSSHVTIQLLMFEIIPLSGTFS